MRLKNESVMTRCPVCHGTNDVEPLVEAMRSGSTLRWSEFGWMTQADWGSLPSRHTTTGGSDLARRVIGQLKRPTHGPRGALLQAVGVVLGLVLAFGGIPALIFGLLRLLSLSFWFLPAILFAWLVGVALLLSRALSSRRPASPYLRAIARLSNLSYCQNCEVVFETGTGRTVPVDRLHSVLYSSQ